MDTPNTDTNLALLYEPTIPSLVRLADLTIVKSLKKNPQLWKNISKHIPSHLSHLSCVDLCSNYMQQTFNDIIEQHEDNCSKTTQFINEIQEFSLRFGSNNRLIERIINLRKLAIQECPNPGLAMIKTLCISNDGETRKIWNLLKQDLIQKPEGLQAIIRSADQSSPENEIRTPYFSIQCPCETTIDPLSESNYLIHEYNNSSDHSLIITNHQGDYTNLTLDDTGPISIAVHPSFPLLGILNLETGNLNLYNHDLTMLDLDRVHFYAFTADKHKLLIVDLDHALKVFDLLKKHYTILATTPDDKFGASDKNVAVLKYSKKILIVNLWNIVTQEKIFKLLCTAPFDPPTVKVLLNTKGNILSLYDKNKITVWSIDKKQKILDTPFKNVCNVHFINDNYLALLKRTCDSSLYLSLLNFYTGNYSVRNILIHGFCYGNKSIVLDAEDTLKQIDFCDQTLIKAAENCNNAQIALLNGTNDNEPLKLCTQNFLYQDYITMIPQLKELTSIITYTCRACIEKQIATINNS